MATKIDYTRPPNLTGLDDSKLIQVTDVQLGRMSVTPPGSLHFFRANGILKTAAEGSTVYRVGDLRSFCASRIQEASLRIASALKAASPGISENELVAQALKQLHAETK